MLWEYLVILTISGGFGGFIAAFSSEKKNDVILPFCEGKALRLAFLGDIAIGIAAALVSYTLLGIIPNTQSQQQNKPTADTAARYIGLGIAAGYTGIKVLDRASIELLREKQKELSNSLEVVHGEVAKSATVNDLISEGRTSTLSGKYHLAIEIYKRTLEIDPTNSSAKLGLAVASNYLNSNDHVEPVKLINEVIQSDPNLAKAYYNRACIKALNQESYSTEEIMKDLKEAIRLDENYRQIAQTDDDFKSKGFRDTSVFKELVQPQL
jgi:tetratricopeptide (TPR) repeat protein